VTIRSTFRRCRRCGTTKYVAGAPAKGVRTATVVLAMLLAAGAAAEQIPPATDYTEAVAAAQGLARTLLAEDSLPGLSVAVGVDGRIVWAEGFGWADLADSVPVTTRTRFRSGSSTKPLTATAAALLYEHGRLDLDAPVQRYVPDFPKKRWPVTTRHLLGHVSGVRHYGSEEEAFSRQHCDGVLDGLSSFAADSLLFQPGTAYQYSTYGYNLVGAVVQAAAGRPFLDFLEAEIMSPLGMEDTGPDFADRPVPNRASFYFPKTESQTRLGIEEAPQIDQSCKWPGGGLVSTPSDLVRFGLAMLAGRLLQPETLTMLQTLQRLDSGEPTEYGLGWFIHEVRLGPGAPPTRIVGHGGSSIGGTTGFMTFPEHGLVVAIMSNVSYAGVQPLSARIARLFIQAGDG
jgi:serine beta-lactamase-like protein LACTB